MMTNDHADDHDHDNDDHDDDHDHELVNKKESQVTTWIIHLAPVGVCFLIAGQILEMEVLMIIMSS